jgi:hypothetical protein
VIKRRMVLKKHLAMRRKTEERVRGDGTIKRKIK